MSILIMSIISFIIAFMPFFKTMLITIFLSVCTIILAVVYSKKQKVDAKEKNKKEIPTIAIMISVMAIFISLINFNITTEFGDEPIDLLQSKIQSFQEYDLKGEAIVENKIKFSVKDVSFDGNKCLVNIEIVGIGEETKVSLSDFFIYNSVTEEISFASDSAENNVSYYSKISKDEKISDTLIFELKKAENLEELYLVYKDDDNSVKIKI